jgi:hypothetical protein
LNIFVLDRDIVRCARAHCDQHVIKMILESVQILCTALNQKGIKTPYRSTHVKHPCVLWAGESYDNFCWLRALAFALNEEYRFRYRKEADHKSIAVLKTITGARFSRGGRTPFAQAMPEKYRVAGRRRGRLPRLLPGGENGVRHLDPPAAAPLVGAFTQKVAGQPSTEAM